MSQPNTSESYSNKKTLLKAETAVDILKQKTDFELITELKTQWNLMWRERFNDRIKAESISVTNYSALNVGEGTVIQASRDFKILNFKELLEQHKIEHPDRFIPPNSNIGGWNKFIKTKITSKKHVKEKQATVNAPVKPSSQQLKKGGRGWLHTV